MLAAHVGGISRKKDELLSSGIKSDTPQRNKWVHWRPAAAQRAIAKVMRATSVRHPVANEVVTVTRLQRPPLLKQGVLGATKQTPTIPCVASTSLMIPSYELGEFVIFMISLMWRLDAVRWSTEDRLWIGCSEAGIVWAACPRSESIQRQIVGNFVVVCAGHYGTVRIGTHKVTGARVAVKTIPKRKPIYVQMLKNEVVVLEVRVDVCLGVLAGTHRSM